MPNFAFSFGFDDDCGIRFAFKFEFGDNGAIEFKVGCDDEREIEADDVDRECEVDEDGEDVPDSVTERPSTINASEGPSFASGKPSPRLGISFEIISFLEMVPMNSLLPLEDCDRDFFFKTN